MRRRQFVAAAGSALTVAFAGCSRPPRVDLELTPLRKSRLGDRLVTAADELGPDARTAVARAHGKGEYVRTADGSRPLVADGRVVGYAGRVWTVRTTRVGVERRELETFDVVYTGRGDNTTVAVDDDVRVVDYADLPPADREMFDAVGPEALMAGGAAMGAVGGYDYPDDADSVFVPEQEYDAVEYEGGTFLVDYEGSRTVENARFRYELDPLAPDVATYVERRAEAVVFVLDAGDLTEEQRDVLDSAMDGGYGEERELSDGFAALLDRLRDHDRLGVTFADWASVARYRGTEYLVEISDNDYDARTTDRPYRLPDDDDDGTTNGTTTDAPTV